MSQSPASAPIVLVHGGRHGGWCWERLVPLLEGHGHPVRWPTLTGLGERAHLIDRMPVDLRTHIDDIVGVIVHNDLHDVVLVGHSYAGMVIAGVAGAIPERIGHLVYLDALVPHSFEAHLELADPERRDDLERLIEEQGGGTRVPALASGLAYFGITNPDDEDWVRSRLTDQPAATYRQRLGDISAADSIARTFIRCTQSHLVPAVVWARAQDDPGMRVIELDAGHGVMITDPALLAPVLLEIANTTAR